MSNQLFQPDVLHASQFFATRRRQAPNKSGEYQLLVAVLADAVERFKKYVLTGDRHFEEAAQWIMRISENKESPSGESAGLSFEYVCSVLDFDPDYLRRGLQRWREAQTAVADKRPRRLPTKTDPPK